MAKLTYVYTPVKSNADKVEYKLLNRARIEFKKGPLSRWGDKYLDSTRAYRSQPAAAWISS